MAKNTQKSNLVANAEADAVARLLDNGYLRIYAGTQPANGDAALPGDAVLLSEHRFSATSAPAAVGGVATFNAVGSANAVATGTAAWYRTFRADGTTRVYDGSVGTADANAVFSTVAFQQNAQVTVASFVYSSAKAVAGF